MAVAWIADRSISAVREEWLAWQTARAGLGYVRVSRLDQMIGDPRLAYAWEKQLRPALLTARLPAMGVRLGSTSAGDASGIIPPETWMDTRVSWARKKRSNRFGALIIAPGRSYADVVVLTKDILREWPAAGIPPEEAPRRRLGGAKLLSVQTAAAKLWPSGHPHLPVKVRNERIQADLRKSGNPPVSDKTIDRALRALTARAATAGSSDEALDHPVFLLNGTNN